MTKLLTTAALALVLVTSAVQAQVPPPPAPLGWVYTCYTSCPEPHTCPVVFVSVAADGLNVRIAPDGPPVLALVNGNPLLVLDRQGSMRCRALTWLFDQPLKGVPRSTGKTSASFARWCAP